MTHPMRTDHAIVYAAGVPHNRRAALSFAGTHALVSVSVLIGTLPAQSGRRLAGDLLLDRFVTGQSHPELQQIDFRLIDGAAKRENRTRNARFVCAFNCPKIGESIERLLDGFEPSPSIHSDDGQLTSFALSAFVVLEIDRDGCSEALLRVRRTLESALLHRKSSEIRFRCVRRLDRVASVSTPFANAAFFKSVHLGSVANVFGRDECLFVISQPLPAGSDGGAVYNERLELTGIVISTTFRWRNTENATLTLVAHVAAILESFLHHSGQSIDGQQKLQVRRIRNGVSAKPDKFVRSIVLIETGSSTGSGCLVRIRDQRFILTCSHVVASASPADSIKCTWQKDSFHSRILYKNPNFGCAYDIALLCVPDDDLDGAHFATFNAGRSLRLGQRIYAIGFPHFFALAREDGFAPSIYEGRVTRIEAHMVLTDASVQAGQSGGPLLNDGGQVVGVMVSNTRQANGHINANVNMCVPLTAIGGILERYAETKDVRVLRALEADDAIVRSWNLQDDLVVSKL